MADVDTSAEAVERRAVAADEVWADLCYLMGRASSEGHDAGQRLACEVRIKLQHTAATLRALAAGNAALRAERDAAQADARRYREALKAGKAATAKLDADVSDWASYNSPMMEAERNAQQQLIGARAVLAVIDAALAAKGAA